MTNTSDYDDPRKLQSQDGRYFDNPASPDPTKMWQHANFDQFYNDRFQYTLFLPRYHDQSQSQNPQTQSQNNHVQSINHDQHRIDPRNQNLLPHNPHSIPHIYNGSSLHVPMQNQRRFAPEQPETVSFVSGLPSATINYVSKESSPDDFLTYFDFSAHDSTPATPKDHDLAPPNNPKPKESLHVRASKPPVIPKKKPTFIPLHNLDNKLLLKFKEPLASSHSDSSFDVDDHLRIQDPDLEGFPGDDYRLHQFQTDTTPLMKPPTSIQNDYFDFYDTGLERKSTNSSKDMANNTGSDQEFAQFVPEPELEPLPFHPPEYHPDPFDVEPVPLAKLYISHLDIERPTFHRTDSNQSNASISSIGSNKDAIKKKKPGKGSVCVICEKFISRDLTRHMRIHDEVGRFKCVYPRSTCSHKTGKFNRPYDYKKHLLRAHFKFDNPRGRSHSTLTDMIPLDGLCAACGARFLAQDWLNDHVLGGTHRCPGLVRGDQ